MYGGYLVIETDGGRPGFVRITERASIPAEPTSRRGREPRMLYAARFDDLSAGHMHAHAALRHCLVDVDECIYRSDPISAIAAVDAVDLSHRVAYLDPRLERDPELVRTIAERRKRLKLAHRIWQAVGVIAVLLLLIKLLLGF